MSLAPSCDREAVAPSSTASDADLSAAIAVVVRHHPRLWWGGWWINSLSHPAGIEQCRAAMTQPRCVGQFRRALVLIEGATRTQGAGRAVSCYGWKHRCERLHRANSGDDACDYYVGEGMFIAAACASGLVVRRDGARTFVNLAAKSYDDDWFRQRRAP